MSSAAQAGAILGGLQKANGILALATVAEGLIVPFIQGIIKEVQTKTAADGTVEYTIVLATGQEELNKIKAQALGDLTNINDILVAAGQPPIEIPADNPPPATP
jgi:hypothetical protein